MAAINEQMTHESYLDRLEHQRHSLEKHLADLEQQIIETGRHHAAVSEHIRRLRGRVSPMPEMVK